MWYAAKESKLGIQGFGVQGLGIHEDLRFNLRFRVASDNGFMMVHGLQLRWHRSKPTSGHCKKGLCSQV